ncbi:MAG TPA: hypothetical protein VFE03_08915, partial [Caulobacteraceae bacterium]|nr:hypothetical protein [Caulobacteraceae bacterium]
KGSIWEMKVMLSDDTDHLDRPIWVRLSVPNDGEPDVEKSIRELVLERFVPAGFKVSRLENIGQKGELRTDY